MKDTYLLGNEYFLTYKSQSSKNAESSREAVSKMRSLPNFGLAKL